MIGSSLAQHAGLFYMKFGNCAMKENSTLNFSLSDFSNFSAEFVYIGSLSQKKIPAITKVFCNKIEFFEFWRNSVYITAF